MRIDCNPSVMDLMEVDRIDFSASMISHEISRKSEDQKNGLDGLLFA
jgi:hypothetical protein